MDEGVGGPLERAAMHVELETERLLLRRFTEGDVDRLFDLDNDPEVMRFLNGGIATPRDVIENEILPGFVRSCDRFVGYGQWAGVEKATSDFLGWFSFEPWDGGSRAEVRLGYRLRRLAWGKGYATEGARALIRKGFTELGVQRVVADTYEENLASRRVMEKAGLTLVRMYRTSPEDLLASATYHVASLELWDGNDVDRV